MYNEIKKIYPLINDNDFLLQDDGSGVYIKKWNFAESKPTIEAIEAVAGAVLVDEQMALLKTQLTQLEQAALMPRGAREAFIALCLQQGAAAHLTPTQLYAANPFFKGLKDTDAIAADLRAQIKAL